MPLQGSATRVAELVRALALAWKNLSAYPPGHPALHGSVEAVDRMVAAVRGPAGDVALGIASDGVLYGDEKVGTLYAQKFAHALFTRGVAVVRFAHDSHAGDIEAFLRALGRPPSAGRPLWEELTAAGVTSVILEPVDYSAVKVIEMHDAPASPKPASLWDDIVRALLAGREISPSALPLSRVQSVDDLTAMLLHYLREASQPAPVFDADATFGVRLGSAQSGETVRRVTSRVAQAIAAHVASATGTRRQIAVQQVIQLLRALPEPLWGAVMRSVLNVLATDENAGSLLREFVGELPRDEVLEALRYLSGVSKLSVHATRLLQATTPLEKSGQGMQLPVSQLVSDMVSLFGEEDIDRFNPPDHRVLLDAATIELPAVREGDRPTLAVLGDRVDSVSDDAVNQQLGRTLIDLLASHGTTRDAQRVIARIVSLFTGYIEAGRFDDALDLARRAQRLKASASGDGPALFDSLLQQISGEQTLRAIIRSLVTMPADRSAPVAALLDVLGESATRTMLLALAEENNRSRRRRLFDFVAGLGPRIVPQLVEFLDDGRWYVVRNMVALLRAVNDRTALPRLRQLADHPDLRVRMEAIKALLALDAGVSSDLLERVINASDPKLAETAVTLVGNYGIREGAAPLVRILERTDFLGRRRSLRLRAIRALGELAEPATLPGLERFFRTSFLPWPSKSERRAVYESLASYPPQATAAYVERGLRSRDRVIREICERMSGQ